MSAADVSPPPVSTALDGYSSPGEVITEADRAFMRMALEEAERARGQTHPNPCVGCVIVRDGQVLARGFHTRAGQPHAEVEAIRNAGEVSLQGATFYVTLEPCSHHGRTPPCADALVKAGAARVVSGMVDPNPLVSGRGLQRLKDAGISVVTGVLQEECRALNESFVVAVTLGRPWVTLKAAVSLDGRVATRTGESQWISGEASRAEVHRMRADHDAILVGSGTLRADNPRLTARIPGENPRQPHRYAIDTRLEVPDEAALLEPGGPPVTLICALGAASERAAALRSRGVDVVELPAVEGRIPVTSVLALLMQRGQIRLLVEGGAELAGAFVDAGCVDRLVLFVAPLLLGGREAPAALGGLGVGRLTDALRARRTRVQALGDDWMLVAEFEHAPK
jgi:diaminohydroxyphosphoribosylaminopyrimidine deaminase/5-amino-6-(5-phosphoribosylamino)uracil reductase